MQNLKEDCVFNWLKVEMAQSDIKITFEDLKAFTTKISVNKWHNSDKQIYRQESSRIVARVL
jgi:hypothetical protein